LPVAPFNASEARQRILARLSVSERCPCEQPDGATFSEQRNKAECKGCEPPIIQDSEQSKTKGVKNDNK